MKGIWAVRYNVGDMTVGEQVCHRKDGVPPLESSNEHRPPPHSGVGYVEPWVYFCFCQLGLIFFPFSSCLVISVFGRRLGSETVTPTEDATVKCTYKFVWGIQKNGF